jgi:hypothetical protein
MIPVFYFATKILSLLIFPHNTNSLALIRQRSGKSKFLVGHPPATMTMATKKHAKQSKANLGLRDMDGKGLKFYFHFISTNLLKNLFKICGLLSHLK